MNKYNKPRANHKIFNKLRLLKFTYEEKYNMLKKISLSITLFGIFLLLGLLIYQPIKEIISPDELNKIEINELVIIEEKISEIYTSEKYSHLTFNNGLQVIISKPYAIQYQNKIVSVLGKIESFYDKKKIKVLRIKIIE